MAEERGSSDSGSSTYRVIRIPSVNFQAFFSQELSTLHITRLDTCNVDILNRREAAVKGAMNEKHALLLAGQFVAFDVELSGEYERDSVPRKAERILVSSRPGVAGSCFNRGAGDDQAVRSPGQLCSLFPVWPRRELPADGCWLLSWDNKLLGTVRGDKKGKAAMRYAHDSR